MNDWRTRAVCLDKDPELFFPKSDDIEGRAAAIAVCGPCPVRTECLAIADRFGVWGGQYFGPNEEGTTAGRPRKAREHGTPTGYRQHLRDGDEVCGPCLAAQRDEWNSRSELKRERKRVAVAGVRA